MKRIAIITIVLLALAIGLLGAAYSPRVDSDPLLLSPDLAQTIGYLRFVSARIDVLQRADGRLADVLNAGEDASDLLEQARQARTATEDALAVVEAVDRQQTPPELETLKLILAQAAQDYVAAGRLVVLFVNTPTEEAHNHAILALDTARASLTEAHSRWTRLNPH
ncbi:MAG: hypothetical protein JW850_12920 [Thermoflexales bacterium]|nr:hypothetical protein [Thermoflexales bacterium]